MRFISFFKQDLATYGIYAEGKKQFQIDVDVNVDEPDYPEYKTAGNVDY